MRFFRAKPSTTRLLLAVVEMTGLDILDASLRSSMTGFVILISIKIFDNHCGKREDRLWGGKPHSFGELKLTSSQATLISRCHCEKY